MEKYISKYIGIYALSIVLIIFIYMVLKGAVNYNKIEYCNYADENTFCGIKEINLSVPNKLKQKILELVNYGSGKRVVIPQWKAGKTITTSNVIKDIPELYRWYKWIAPEISNIIGEKVYTTSKEYPTTCSILIYDQKDDFINWHYDVNYFDGRFFTLIIPVTFTKTCTKYKYYDKNYQIQSLSNVEGKSILFEGDKVFHMASKFCENDEKRIVISLQYSTNPNIGLHNQLFLRIKDSAYVGIIPGL